MCDYELLLKTQVALDLTMFIQGHSPVSIRFCTTPLHVKVLAGTVLCQYGFLLPLYMYKFYCHSAVSIRFFTTPLHVQVLSATALCQ